MRRAPWDFCVAVLLALSLGVLPCVAAQDVKTEPLAEWSPAAKLLDHLSPEVVAEAYRVRPPANYELKLKRDDPGYKLWTWAGPRRSDKSAGTFALSLTSIPRGERLARPEFYLNSDMEHVRNARDQFHESKPEYGTINGMTFARAKWTGRQKGTNLKMSGFSYVAVEGRTVITILSQDYVPYDEDLLLAEAAAQTLRKP